MRRAKELPPLLALALSGCNVLTLFPPPDPTHEYACHADTDCGDAGLVCGGDGFCEPVDREHSAYIFLLRDPERALLGAVGVVCRES